MAGDVLNTFDCRHCKVERWELQRCKEKGKGLSGMGSGCSCSRQFLFLKSFSDSIES
jgi:hypothetical protein